MACLTREKIAQVNDLSMQKVPVPEWSDGDPEAYVMLKSLTAKEQGMFDSSIMVVGEDPTKPKVDTVDYGPKLALASMCDDEGNRIFSANDLEILQGKSAKALNRVVKAAMALNGIGEKEILDAEKNSVPSQGDSLPLS